MKLVPIILAIVVSLSFVGSPSATGNGPKFEMTEAAFNVKVWQAVQRTAIARASATKASTPIPTPTVV